MTNFKKALDNKKKNLKNFITESMKTAADIGCGNGVDSITLSSLNIIATGFDPSPKMIETAIKNSKESNQKINFYNYAAKDIPAKFNSQFDFICSLGNTIANIPTVDLESSIKRFHTLLSKDGKLLLHILNYEKIVKENERIINIKEGKKDFIVRFYDFENGYLNFNILKFNKHSPNEKLLITTKLFPHKLRTLQSLLKESGFSKIKLYSDLSLATFSKETSKDIYLLCSKG